MSDPFALVERTEPVSAIGFYQQISKLKVLTIKMDYPIVNRLDNSVFVFVFCSFMIIVLS